MKGVIDFSKIRAKLSVTDESIFCISVQIKGGKIKEFIFKTITKGSLATWITLINMQMSNAEVCAASELLRSEDIMNQAPVNFWKVCRISSPELLENAQTGDILLFTGKKMQDKLIRGVTGSRYDHVGMLVKYNKTGQLLIFESLAGRGVSRWHWQ